jgi:hypothetical protein
MDLATKVSQNTPPFCRCRLGIIDLSSVSPVSTFATGDFRIEKLG